MRFFESASAMAGVMAALKSPNPQEEFTQVQVRHVRVLYNRVYITYEDTRTGLVYHQRYQ